MLRAACTHMWGNREYWSAAGSAGFGDLSFFKFSGKNMKLEWCRVDIFEGQGEGRTEGKKVIIFFEIPSAQKAANPQDWAHINWSPLIGEWKYLRRVSSTIMSASTHNNILGVTLSGDFCDVCTLSDLRPNHSWATPHKISLCLARPSSPNKLIPFLTIFLFLVSSQVLKTMWSCGREFVQTDLNNMEYSWKLAHWIDLATIYFPILLAIFPELSQPIILTEQRRLRLPFPHWSWAGQAFNLDQSEASIYKLFPTCYLKFPK